MFSCMFVIIFFMLMASTYIPLDIDRRISGRTLGTVGSHAGALGLAWNGAVGTLIKKRNLWCLLQGNWIPAGLARSGFLFCFFVLFLGGTAHVWPSMYV